MVAASAKKVDITQHALVPSHKILSKEEATEVLEKFNISPVQLPSILATDPIIKSLGGKVADIIQIERKRPLQSGFYYRRVVE